MTLHSINSRRLRTQTSVMNGSLEAENMEVDKVCDAGGIFDNDDHNDGPAPSRVRWDPEIRTSCARHCLAVTLLCGNVGIRQYHLVGERKDATRKRQSVCSVNLHGALL